MKNTLEQFEFMYKNFERLENDEIEYVSELMNEAFGIDLRTAKRKLITYYYRRSMRKPKTGYEADGKVIFVYESRLNKDYKYIEDVN